MEDDRSAVNGRQRPHLRGIGEDTYVLEDARWVSLTADEQRILHLRRPKVYTAGSTEGRVEKTRVGGRAMSISTGPGVAAFAPARKRRVGDPPTPKGDVMRGRKWLAVAIAVGSVSTGVAVAGSGSSETSPVQGDFHADLVRTKQRACDADHVRLRLRFEGSQTSSDPRLEGDLEANVESVVNTHNGYGYTSGSVVITRSGSHRTKFRGEVVGVVEPDGGAEGFLTGRTVGRRSVRLLANFNVDQDADTGAITGEFGKDSQIQDPYAPTEDQDPAVLTNACSDGHH
jgi:hypothetical protein